MSELLRLEVFETKEDIQEAIKTLQKYVGQLEQRLAEIEGDINNHIYPDLDTAMGNLEGLFDSWANNDCEGSHCCGSPEYTQEFIVDDVKYMGIGLYEYNRHDKTYYYIDGSSFKYVLLEDYAPGQ